jgi:hypothetical protein
MTLDHPASIIPDPKNTRKMSQSKPFPAITGSCFCNTVRYRLLTSPLYCYACHCIDCQKGTGSAFGLFLNIELYNIKVISPTAPINVAREKKTGLVDRHAICPQCHVELWANNTIGDAVCDLKVGTLDFPSLMEPDVHCFVESKLDWIRLPEGAKSTPKGFRKEEHWPKSSLKRFELCMQRAEEIKKRKIAAIKLRGNGEEGDAEISAEGEKTPTALEFGGEDDEAMEKRCQEMENSLQERLEKLSLKLEKDEVTKKMGEAAI